jgi:hypothetical protein
MVKTASWGVALVAVSLIVGHSTPVRAEGKYLHVLSIKPPADVKSYLEQVKKARTIAMRLGMPPSRVWRATLAGSDTARSPSASSTPAWPPWKKRSGSSRRMVSGKS